MRGLTIIAVPEEEEVLLDLPVQPIADDQVLTMAVHVVLCTTGIVDQTGGGVLIMAGTGVLNTADIAGIVFEVNFFFISCSYVPFLNLFILLFIYSRSPVRRSRT